MAYGKYGSLVVGQEYVLHFWAKATDNFKNDSYVKDYYEKAKQNEAIMNGTADQPMPEGQQMPAVPAPPTPSQMATPIDSLTN